MPNIENKRFIKNDSAFTCANCGRAVPPLGYSSRNHCPHCLWSLHVDLNPGDRACACLGKMEPRRAEPDPKKGYIITHLCRSCGASRRCRSAADDNLALIIRLTVAE